MRRMVPNLISLVRGLVIAPLVLHYGLHGQWAISLTWYAIGGATDALDGKVAGWLNARSRIGKEFIDPVCDGALLLAAWAGLYAAGKLSVSAIVIFLAISGVFTALIRFAPKVTSRRAEGLFPFYGFGIGLITGIWYAMAALTKREFYILVPIAVIVGIFVAWFKRNRIQEAIGNITQITCI